MWAHFTCSAAGATGGAASEAPEHENAPPWAHFCVGLQGGGEGAPEHENRAHEGTIFMLDG